MSLFRWIEGKLERLDSGNTLTSNEELLAAKLEEVTKECQALQEQASTLRSDLRTTRNFADQQLEVSFIQAKDALLLESAEELRSFRLETERQLSESAHQIETLQKENSQLRLSYEETTHKLERFEALFASCANALTSASETNADVTEFTALYETAQARLTEIASLYESALKDHSFEQSQSHALISLLKTQIDTQRCSEESFTEARNIEALNEHLQAKQRIIEGLLSEKTMLMLKLDRQTKENLEMMQTVAGTQDKEKMDSISSLRLFRSRMWLRKPCESIDRCFRWGLDYVRDHPLSRLAVLTYWLMVQLYILMVVMNAGSGSDQFIYQTTLAEPVEEAIVHLVELTNKRVITDRIAVSLEELIKFGALKPEATRGLQEGDPAEPPRPDLVKSPDEHHYRIGWAVPPELGVRMLETTAAAKQLLNKANADRRVPISASQLDEACSLMKGALMMAYPGYHTLESWEPVVMLLENRDVEAVLSGDELMKPENCSLWFAGKELQRGKLLSNFIKGTEQTKAIVKLQKSSAGAPVREPLVDAETQKQMIAMYHKRQEEAKQLVADSEDDYLNSAWADPKRLKRDLHGSNDIAWRPR